MFFSGVVRGFCFQVLSSLSLCRLSAFYFSSYAVCAFPVLSLFAFCLVLAFPPVSWLPAFKFCLFRFGASLLVAFSRYLLL